MESQHPYLFINDDMNLEWVVGNNAKIKGIHQPTMYYKKDLGFGSDELVTNFVRFNRNYYSVYLLIFHLYIQPDGILARQKICVLPLLREDIQIHVSKYPNL